VGGHQAPRVPRHRRHLAGYYHPDEYFGVGKNSPASMPRLTIGKYQKRFTDWLTCRRRRFTNRIPALKAFIFCSFPTASQNAQRAFFHFLRLFRGFFKSGLEMVVSLTKLSGNKGDAMESDSRAPISGAVPL